MNRIFRNLILLVITIMLFACNGKTSTLAPSSSSGDQGERGIVWVDWDASEILVMESYPMQVVVIARGDIPSPCHEIHWEVDEPNQENEIHITGYSTVDPNENCASLLEAFEERIPVGDFKEGGYSVWVNEREVGDF